MVREVNIQKFGLLILLWLFKLLLNGNAFAQERVVIQRLTSPVQFDGMSNEDAWKHIDPLPMIMHAPVFGKQPTEKTEVFLGYDDTYLYMAGRLYQTDPEMIQATSKKRDFMGANSDWFGFILDTFNDKENGVSFFTTPAGLRLDMTVFNDAQASSPEMMPVNISWNTYWDVKTVQDERGWFVEMRVPFSSLRYQQKGDQTVMGVIVWRYIAQTQENCIWPPIPPNWGMFSAWKVSRAQEVVFHNIPPKKPVYITPYVLGGYERMFELNDAETLYEKHEDYTLEGGLDVKYGLTSNLTMDVSLNTDFAQVEADDQQVNLTRFSLFFPEKRQFFQERSSNFSFSLGGPQDVFYSRRIGIYDGAPVRILGGARIVGRVGSWDLGLMTMQTARSEEIGSENFSVVRMRRRVINPNSYVGGIVTSRIRADGWYNAVYGVDGIFRVFGDDYLKVHWAQAFEDSLRNELLSLDNGRFSLNWERRNLRGLAYQLGYSRSGKDFDPGIGFMMRDDYTRIGERILYGWICEEASSLLRHNIFFKGFWVGRNSDGTTESMEMGTGWEYFTKPGAFGNIHAKFIQEDIRDTLEFTEKTVVPPGRYSFYGVKGLFSTPMGHKLMAMFDVEAGSFYDGYRVSAGLTPTWSLGSDVELNGYYQYNRVVFDGRGQALTAHIGRLRATWMLSTALSLSAFVQYNSAVDAFITNVRFRFNPKEGNDLYIVYDEGLNFNRMREIPALPISGNRTLLLKYTYTFLF